MFPDFALGYHKSTVTVYFGWLVPNWVLCLYWTWKNRTESKSRFFVQNQIEIDRLAKISYRHSTII